MMEPQSLEDALATLQDLARTKLQLKELEIRIVVQQKPDAAPDAPPSFTQH